ncbi:MAG: redoxin domain-containing protein [Bacteroidia bacterium]|nr:redoxin domain-containing protein [Bacteroidia bacterium]
MLSLQMVAYIYFFFCFVFLSFAVNGQRFHSFTLLATSGKTVNLKEFQKKRAIVLVFFSNYCIYAQKYHPRIQSYIQEYSSKDIQFLFINSNDPAQSIQDNFAYSKEYVAIKEISVPYLLDSLQQIAKNLQVFKNPECIVAIWDSDSYKILYRGMIDNDPLSVHKLRNDYLRTSLENIVMGSLDTIPYTKPLGCDIRWRE